MKRLLIALGCLTVPVSLLPFPGLSAQKRAITIDDYLALKSVGNPQLSPDGKWVARSEEHTSELQSRLHLVCRLLLEKNKQVSNISPRGSVHRSQRAQRLRRNLLGGFWRKFHLRSIPICVRKPCQTVFSYNLRTTRSF